MVIQLLRVSQCVVRIVVTLAIAAVLYSASLFCDVPTGSQSGADLLARADQLADQGNWFAAGPLYERAEVAFRNAHDARHELYAKIGRLHRDVQSGSYRAVRLEVVKCLARTEAQSDPELKIRIYSLLGNIDLNLKTAAAEQDWKQMLAIARDAGDSKWVNRANGQLGIIEGTKGNVGAAGASLFKSLSRAEEIGDVSGYVYFSIWLANGMSVHGMADRALQVIDRAMDLAKRKGFVETPVQLSIAKVRAMMLLPEPEKSRRRPEAKALLVETLSQAERNQVLGAQTELLNFQGQIALEENDLPGAEKALTRSIAVAESASLPRLEADALLHLSQFYRNTNQSAKADPVIKRAIDRQQQSEEGYDLPLFIAEEAEVRAALGSLHEADSLYQRATNLVEGLLVNASSSRVKSSMIGAMSEIYLDHFRLVWNQLHNGPEAFRIIESARGRALLDSMRFAGQSSPTTESTAAEREISQLQSTLLHSKLSAAQTKRVLAQLDEAYDRLSPIEYARSRSEMAMLSRPPVTVTELRKQLQPGETIVEYVVDTKVSYAMQVTTAGLQIHTLPGRAELSQAIKSFVGEAKSKKDASTAAQGLYKSLITPLTVRSSERLVIVPDGPLNLIPFSALVADDGEYLGASATVSSSPSATVYVTLKTAVHRTTAARPFLGVAYSPVSGGPEYSTGAPVQTASINRGLSDLRGNSPEPLQFAKQEVIEAANAISPNSVTLVGAEATESGLKSQPLADFKIIHLAAHGIGDESEPDRSGLVLFPGSKNEDGLWQSREIRHSRFNADLVVLSACETGSGRLQGEEGVMNLARSFLSAGARSVVASLWSVEDSSTATLMEFFYDHLAKGISVGDSLREAQADYRREYKGKAQPYYWAGFEVIGDGTRRINLETHKSNVQAAR